MAPGDRNGDTEVKVDGALQQSASTSSQSDFSKPTSNHRSRQTVKQRIPELLHAFRRHHHHRGLLRNTPSFQILRRKTWPSTVEDYYLNTKDDLDELVPDENKRLGELAHARPALEVRAPAFFRHVMFFFPHRAKERRILYPGDFNRNLAKKRLADLLASLCDKEYSLISDELEKEFALDRTYILPAKKFHGFDFRVIVDIYAEYATLTLLLDNHEKHFNKESGSNLRAMIGDIESAIAKHNVDANKEQFERCFETEYSHSGFTYFGIWDLFNFEKNVTLADAKIGNMVADFRGFAVTPFSDCIVQEGDAEKSDVQNPVPQTNKDDKDWKYRFIPSSMQVRPEQNVLQYLHNNVSFFLNLLGLEDKGAFRWDGAPPDPRIEPNVILCRMLDGDAIYGSALGNNRAYPKRRVIAHREKDGRHIPPTPITYFLIHNGQSANQLGRMIRRQNLLGELRLAALFDAETIMRLGPPIRRLTALVLKLIGEGTKQGVVGHRQFRQILDLYREIGGNCHGGFLYRMARADYYYEALQTRLADTRSHPIPPWQSYPGFINRHFDQRFRSMRSMGQRYRDVGERIERLFSIYTNEVNRIRALATTSMSFVSLLVSIAAFVANQMERKIEADILGGISISLWIIIGVIILSIYYRKPKHSET